MVSAGLKEVDLNCRLKCTVVPPNVNINGEISGCHGSRYEDVWNVAPCSLVEIDCAFYFHHQGDEDGGSKHL
jgi:hypothetical protein